MTAPDLRPEVDSSVDALLRSCRELGLRATLIDPAKGRILAGTPSAVLPGTAALRSACVRAAAADAARGWQGPQPVAPGAWALRVEPEQGGPAILLVSRAPEAQGEPGGPVLVPADALARALSRWAGTAALAAERESTIRAFTAELTLSYETIDLLYGLGRSMGMIDRPGVFLSMTMRRILAVTDLGWIATVLVPSRWMPEPLTGHLHAAGALPAPEPAFHAAIRAWLDRTPASEPRCRIAQASAYVPGVPGEAIACELVADGRRLGLMLCGGGAVGARGLSSYESNILEVAGSFVSSLLENTSLYEQQQSMFVGTLRAFTASIDAKDHYTRGHSERVSRLASDLAKAAGYGDEFAERVAIAGLVHDIGKIGVPESVLCKSGRLTEEEFAHIRRHPEIGFGILREIPALSDVLPGVLSHHERWDGRGYPHALRGEEIPVMARLIGVADTFDAMSSNRSYRPAMPRERVLEEISRCAGSQFDPALPPVFVTLDLGAYDDLLRAQEAGAELPPAQAA